MTQKFLKKELCNAGLSLKQLKTTLIASDMVLSLMEVEELDWKESSCFIVLSKTLEMHLYSQEIPKESLLDETY